MAGITRQGVKLPGEHFVMSQKAGAPSGPDGSPPFEVRYFVPDPDLAERVSSFYAAHINMPLFDEYERADRPQFRIMPVPDGEYIFADGHRFASARATIIGPTSAPVRAVCAGPTVIYGFGLLPAGWAALMGDDGGKLTDRAVDAAEMFGRWIDDAIDTLTGAETIEQKMVVANNIVREIVKPDDAAPLWFIRTVDAWLTGSASPQVADLVAETGMSIRSVERMTKYYYGLPPRMLARKYRALRAASALARGEDLETALRGDAFYDQSHLIREVKRFAGATPGRLANPTLYTKATIKGRNQMAGKVSPLVSET
jgi:AraC-like DNA-binding protein